MSTQNFKKSDLFVAKGLINGTARDISFRAETTFSALGDTLDRLYESGAFDTADEQLIEADDGTAIVIDSPAVSFPSLGLEAYSGSWMERDEDGDLYPDWSLTLIHDAGKPLSEGYYVEQDNIQTALHNYLTMVGILSEGDTGIDVEVAAA